MKNKGGSMYFIIEDKFEDLEKDGVYEINEFTKKL